MLQLFDREAFWLGMGFPYSLDSITGVLMLAANRKKYYNCYHGLYFNKLSRATKN